MRFAFLGILQDQISSLTQAAMQSEPDNIEKAIKIASELECIHAAKDRLFDPNFVFSLNIQQKLAVYEILQKEISIFLEWSLECRTLLHFVESIELTAQENPNQQ
jgi:hypothetical protein